MPPRSLHCQFCGASFGELSGWPRTCAACKQTTFRNPIPVGVLMQPVRSKGREGLVVIRRGIEPARGMLALPGGYIEDGEDWKAGACREAREEAGLQVDPGTVVTFDAWSNPEGNRVLLFALAPTVDEEQLPPFTPTAETTERVILLDPQELAFSLHTEAAARYFRDVRMTRRS